MIAKAIFFGLAFILTSTTRAETLVTQAKILDITERGLVLSVGTEPLAVEDSAETKWWVKKEPSRRDSFKIGDTVQARIKTDSDPPILREMADSQTAKWLESIRKEHQKATLAKLDSKYLHVTFPDGSKFAYRITEKSEIKLSSKPSASISDLSVGSTIYVKGRLLPTLDTWVSEVTDTAPAAPSKVEPSKGSSKGSTTAKPKPVKLPTTGKLEAIVLADMPPLKMFDVLVNEINTYHITYNLETKYYSRNKAADRSILVRGMKVLITYKRDQYGRLIASKVEAFPNN